MTIRGPLAIILLVVVILSLAANFLVFGFVAARLSDIRQGNIERIIALGLRGMPAEIRRAAAAEAVEDRAELRQAFADLQAARRNMYAAMRAEPFDQAALDAAMAEVRSRTTAIQGMGQGLIAKAVAQASPQARAAIELPRGLAP
jgi:uncharacterized membrane protein